MGRKVVIGAQARLLNDRDLGWAQPTLTLDFAGGSSERQVNAACYLAAAAIEAATPAAERWIVLVDLDRGWRDRCRNGLPRGGRRQGGALMDADIDRAAATMIANAKKGGR